MQHIFLKVKINAKKKNKNKVLNFEVRMGSVTMPDRVILDLETEGKICDGDSIFI